MTLSREDFFYDEKVEKLTNLIKKKTKEGYTELFIRDKVIIKFLKENEMWLDFAGIYMHETSKTFSIRWRGLQ